MVESFSDPEAGQELIVATIANQKNPAQVVHIVHQPDRYNFVTRGISVHFGLKEIAVPQNLMLPAIEEMTEVLSYILERIATANDLSLPFRYDPEFKLGNRNYILQEKQNFIILQRKQ
jgi:hypothetical protein